MRAFPILALSVLLAMPLGLADSGQTQRYVAAPGDLFTFCEEAGQTLNAGGACFTIPGWTDMGIQISDDSGNPVAAAVSFQDSSGHVLGSNVACNEGAFRLPAGTARVVVSIGQIESHLVCGQSPGTTGSIHIFQIICISCGIF